MLRLAIILNIMCTCLFIVSCTNKKKGKAFDSKTSEDCISYVLKQDDSLGTVRNHACKTMSLSASIKQYANSINDLNFEGCPEDFREAFQNHTKAWIKMGDFTENYSELRGEMHDLFDSIENTKDSLTFKPLLKAIWDTWGDVEASKSYSKNATEVAFEIPEVDLIPEGIAYDKKTETFFVSSTYKRKIVAVDNDGNSRDFTPSGSIELFGVVGMRVDTKRRFLWALSGHAGNGMPMENMNISEQGMSRIHKYNIDSGKLLNSYELNIEDGRNFLNDLTLAENGDVYITDTVKKCIYKIDTETEELAVFYRLEENMSPNGIDITEDQRYLFIAVYGGKNVVRLNVQTKELKVINMPKNEQMIADGLYFYKNHLITIQPRNEGRIVSKYYLDHNLNSIISYTVLETESPYLSQPTTGVIVDDDFYFIANSQLQLFKRIYNKEEEIAELKNPAILKVKLD